MRGALRGGVDWFGAGEELDVELAVFDEVDVVRDLGFDHGGGAGADGVGFFARLEDV